jgi:hypothetical protein
MSGGALKEVLKEVRLVREKVERLEELVEERLIGLEEPLGDEVKAIKEYMNAKEKGSVELIPIEDVKKETGLR